MPSRAIGTAEGQGRACRHGSVDPVVSVVQAIRRFVPFAGFCRSEDGCRGIGADRCQSVANASGPLRSEIRVLRADRESGRRHDSPRRVTKIHENKPPLFVRSGAFSWPWIGAGAERDPHGSRCGTMASRPSLRRGRRARAGRSRKGACGDSQQGRSASPVFRLTRGRTGSCRDFQQGRPALPAFRLTGFLPPAP